MALCYGHPSKLYRDLEATQRWWAHVEALPLPLHPSRGPLGMPLLHPWVCGGGRHRRVWPRLSTLVMPTLCGHNFFQKWVHDLIWTNKAWKDRLMGKKLPCFSETAPGSDLCSSTACGPWTGGHLLAMTWDRYTMKWSPQKAECRERKKTIFGGFLECCIKPLRTLQLHGTINVLSYINMLL